MKADRFSPTAEQLTELHEQLTQLVGELPDGFFVKQAARTAEGREIVMAWKRKYGHTAYEPWRRSRIATGGDRSAP